MTKAVAREPVSKIPAIAALKSGISVLQTDHGTCSTHRPGQRAISQRRCIRLQFCSRRKLRGDPVFRALLERGLLLGPRPYSGLGLRTRAAVRVAQGRPALLRKRQLAARLAAGAQAALDSRHRIDDSRCGARAHGARSECEISQGDIRSVEFGTTDAMVMLDVLHYIGREDQLQVLKRVRGALPARGLLAVAHWRCGWRLAISLQSMGRQAGHAVPRPCNLATHCRSATQWRKLLCECGFEVQATPMSQGTRFANVLLIAYAL